MVTRELYLNWALAKIAVTNTSSSTAPTVDKGSDILENEDFDDSSCFLPDDFDDESSQ